MILRGGCKPPPLFLPVVAIKCLISIMRQFGEGAIFSGWPSHCDPPPKQLAHPTSFCTKPCSQFLSHELGLWIGRAGCLEVNSPALFWLTPFRKKTWSPTRACACTGPNGISSKLQGLMCATAWAGLWLLFAALCCLAGV